MSLDIEALRLTGNEKQDADSFCCMGCATITADAQLAKALWGVAGWLKESSSDDKHMTGVDLEDALEQASIERPS